MKSEQQSKFVSGAALARASHYSPGAISGWTKAGVLKKVRGRYDLVASLEAIRLHAAERASDGGHDDTPELIVLKKQLLERRVKMLDHELDVAHNKVHDKVACCQSLMSIRTTESRVLHGIGIRVAAQFPEIEIR